MTVELTPAEAVFIRRLMAVELRRLRIAALEQSFGEMAQAIEMASMIHDRMGVALDGAA